MGSPPVSVTGGKNQIQVREGSEGSEVKRVSLQVNIKPEQAGHTLISVYQVPPDQSGGYGGQQNDDAGKQADSVPPEPIPSHHMVSILELDFPEWFL